MIDLKEGREIRYKKARIIECWSIAKKKRKRQKNVWVKITSKRPANNDSFLQTHDRDSIFWSLFAGRLDVTFINADIYPFFQSRIWKSDPYRASGSQEEFHAFSSDQPFSFAQNKLVSLQYDFQVHSELHKGEMTRMVKTHKCFFEARD